MTHPSAKPEPAPVRLDQDAATARQPVATPAREGWAQAARVVAAQGADTLLIHEFGNAADEEGDW